MRILDISESLEDKLAKLKELSGRPVYILGTSSYQNLKKALSSEDSAVRIGIGYDAKIEPGMDRELQKKLETEEITRHKGWFKSVGLKTHYGASQYDVDSAFEEDMRPYVKLSHRVRPRRETVEVVRFYTSEEIATPNLQQHEWSLPGSPLEYKSRYTGEVFSTYRPIFPPGQYSGKEIGVAEPFNRYLIVDKAPGDCIVCHGKSGKRKHFGHIAYGPHPYPEGLICSGCFKDAFQEIEEMLEIPPVRHWQRSNEDCWRSDDGHQVGRCHTMSGLLWFFDEDKTGFDSAEEAISYSESLR